MFSEIILIYKWININYTIQFIIIKIILIFIEFKNIKWHLIS
jgi:hypothetical protein